MVPCPDGPPVRLAVHHRVMSVHRRLGRAAFIALSTISSVVVSVVVAYSVSVLLPSYVINAANTREVFSIFVWALVPLVIAPPVTWLLSAVLRELEESIEGLEVLANTDELTGVLNRRGFHAEAERLLKASRGNGQVVLAMVDLDRLKQLNDWYGHEAGDTALLVLAEQLRDVAGQAGVLGRLGGDEFAIMVQVADDSAVADLTRRLGGACRRIPVSGLDDLQASFGHIVVDRAAGIDRSLSQADRELYRMKGRGDRFQPRHVADAADFGMGSCSRTLECP